MNDNMRAVFESMLRQADDQVLVRELLSTIVPEDMQAEVVRRYNLEMTQRVKFTGYNVIEVMRGDTSQR